MTVTDLVRDTCKAASELVKQGANITVTSGKRTLFQIIPPKTMETQMSPRQYKAFLKDLDQLAKSPPENNPVLMLRARRRR